MNTEGSSNKSATKAEFDSDLENWLNSTPWVANMNESEMNYGVDDPMLIEPEDPSQLLMPVVNACTNFGEGSSNVSQVGIPQEMVTNSSLAPSSSTGTLDNSGQILSSAIKTLSNHGVQISQSQITDILRYQPLQTTQTHQNEPLLQQVFNNNAVQQPQTPSFTNQSNITTTGQMNQLHYQMPSNQLLPCTGPMVNIQTPNLHNNQTPRAQMQLNLNQNQLQMQKVTGTSGNLTSIAGLQQTDNALPDLSAPVGYAAPREFSSSEAYREYAIRQIRIMKERYYSGLLKMHSTAMQRYTQATTLDDSIKYENIKTYLERMLRFLNTSSADSIPNNDQVVYNYMNIIVNYVNYRTRDKSAGGCSQHCEPVRQLLNGSSVPLLNPSQRVINIESNKVNFNQNLSSRGPLPQESKTPSSLNNKSFQTGVGQKPENPLRFGSVNASQPTVLTTKQRINPGPSNSVVIGLGVPISLSSNTTATKFPSSALNHQPSVANHQFSSEKMKEPMHKTNEFTRPKTVRAGKSPLGPRILGVNQSPSHQPSLPSRVNPIHRQTSVSSVKLDARKTLSPDSIAKSPFTSSATSSTPSGISALTTVENQKHTTPAGLHCKEPQTSKDAFHHLTEVVKSMSSKALNSAITDISSIENATTNLVGIDGKVNAYDNDTYLNMRRSLTVTSMKNDQFGCQEWDAYIKPYNKRAKSTEIKWGLLEEIKEINAKLLETTIHVVLDPLEDNIHMILGGQNGTILKCYFRNVCFPDLLGPLEGVSSEKMPEFGILLVVPFDFPASAISMFKSGEYALNEPWGKLYEEMLTRFNALVREIRGIQCVGDYARKWDASARAVMTEFMEKLGAKSFSSEYGSWESCIKSPSGSK